MKGHDRLGTHVLGRPREETRRPPPDRGPATPPVNGLQMYYEVHGSGQPLVLLHGNLSTIEVDFGRIRLGVATS
jgi:hypothetical protein